MKICIILVITFFISACSEVPNPINNQTPPDSLIETTLTYFLHTDFQVGMLSYLTYSQGDWRLNEYNYRLSGDPEIALHENYIFIFNRSFEQNASILKINSQTKTMVVEESLEITNPHSMSFLNASKAFITSYDAGNIIVYNPSLMENISNITIPAKNDSTNPAPSKSIIIDEKLFVALQHMQPNEFGLSAAYNGEIAVICTQSYEIINIIELPFRNPISNIVHCPENNALFVSCVGDHFADGDGGIVKIDIAANSAVVFANSQTLGSDPGDAVHIHNNKLYFNHGSWGSYVVSRIDINSPSYVEQVGDTSNSSSVAAFTIANRYIIIAYSAYDFVNHVFYNPEIKIFGTETNELVETISIEMPVYKIRRK